MALAMPMTRRETLKVTKTVKKVTTVKKSPKKSSRILYEDSVDHIEILPKNQLPDSFIKYHTPQFIEGVTHILSVDPSLYRPIVSQNFERYKQEEEREKSEDEIIKSYWLSLISSVMAQQISGSAAAAIYSRFEKLFDKEPNPQELLSKLYEQLREIGLSNQKVKYVIHISEVFSDPDENLCKLKFYQQSDPETIVNELTKLKGIAEWSAKMFAMFTLKEQDIFAHEDLGVARGASYYLSRRPELLKSIKDAVHKDEELKLLLKKKGKFDKPSTKRDWTPYHDQYLIQFSKPYQPFRSILMLILWRLSSTNILVLADSKDEIKD